RLAAGRLGGRDVLARRLQVGARGVELFLQLRQLAGQLAHLRRQVALGAGGGVVLVLGRLERLAGLGGRPLLSPPVGGRLFRGRRLGRRVRLRFVGRPGRAARRLL